MLSARLGFGSGLLVMDFLGGLGFLSYGSLLVVHFLGGLGFLFYGSLLVVYFLGGLGFLLSRRLLMMLLAVMFDRASILSGWGGAVCDRGGGRGGSLFGSERGRREAHRSSNNQS